MTNPISRLDFSIALAKETGEILVQIASSTEVIPSFKADRSIVTEADTKADRHIHNSIHRNFPGEPVLSEELQPFYSLQSDMSDNFLWIIDPIDGTTNFSLGLPFWGVSIACLKNGEPFTAAIYFPLLNELYSAQKGNGAYLNGVPIYSAVAQLYHGVSFFSTCSRTYKHYKVTVPYKARILGSACYTLCSIAKGISILGFEATPKIWDIAAGWLIIQEAGKEIGTLNGVSPFPIMSDIDYAKINFPIIAGASPEITNRAHKQITPIESLT